MVTVDAWRMAGAWHGSAAVRAASRKEVVYGMGQRTRKIVMILNTILFIASLDLQGDWI